MDEKEVILSRIPADMAAALLVGCERLDPSGMTAPHDLGPMAAACQCFAATAPDSQAVYLVRVKNGTAWIDATKGAGPVDWSALLLPIIEAQAKGCAAVGFQTNRPGLVRKAKKQGYTVTGWILKKTLP
jgi:hypothetical protein